jgi:uncharacterized protein YqeY
MTVTLKERIKEDFDFARKNRDKIGLSTITMITDRIQKAEKEQKIELNDAAVLQIIQTYHKQTTEEFEAFQGRGDTDRVAALKEELLIIESYLPKQLSYEEILQRVSAVKEGLGDVVKGILIKNAQQALKGYADPKLVTKAVEEVLS